MASQLINQLEAQAERFLRDASKNRYVPKENTLYLSSIFDWYGEDFEVTGSSVKRFVADRMTTERGLREAIESKDTQIKFLKYDWKLNDFK